jgi:hypothetical protein
VVDNSSIARNIKRRWQKMTQATELHAGSIEMKSAFALTAAGAILVVIGWLHERTGLSRARTRLDAQRI